MRYKITHTTTYTYSDAVPICHNIAHLTPRDRACQQTRFHRLHITPTPAITDKRIDFFGNHVTAFSIQEGHKGMVVAAMSRVDVRATHLPAADATPAWETLRGPASDGTHLPIEAVQYTFPSPAIPLLRMMHEYAAPSFPAGRPILAGVRDLTRRVHADFRYDPRATDLSTPLEKVFEMRRGVRQDFAHIQIGCLRALGLAARYVSGYLRTIPPPGVARLVGADASHAWLSVYCGDHGWIDADPTNDVLPGTDHITVAWGRDYTDIAPIRGVFIGGGTHSMTVAVDVQPMESDT